MFGQIKSDFSYRSSPPYWATGCVYLIYASIVLIFDKVYGGTELTKAEILKFKSAMLYEGAIMDWEKGWTQQFHYGGIRNNNHECIVILVPIRDLI